MRRRVFLLAACALATASCGGPGEGLYAVRGKVFYKGEPATGATVSFVRKAGDRSHDPTPQGVVGEDGSFTLSGPTGEGAAAGEYAVLVEWKEGAGGRGRAPALSAPDRLKGRYLNAAKPLLSAEVKAAANDLEPFELQ
jgi:hypothetical protein